MLEFVIMTLAAILGNVIYHVTCYFLWRKNENYQDVEEAYQNNMRDFIQSRIDKKKRNKK